MSESHLHRDTILPVSDTIPRPLWSVMIPTYNCAGYLRETLASVLAQDPGPNIMQIEVVDDCSTKDDPQAVVEELGRGRVSFYQQPENVGHIKNFQTCLERSKGKLVHLLHGDDRVREGFYHKLQAAFESHPEIGAAFCRHLYMDTQGHWQSISWLEQPQSGILENWLERIAVQQRIQTPSIVVRREVYENLGGYDRRIRYWGEDWEMWVRIAANYPIWYEVEPLALYRTHTVSLSGRSIRTGENIQDFRKAIEIVRDYLPQESADKLSQTALKNYAFYALNTARGLVDNGDATAALNQIKEAFRCCSSLPILRASLKLLIKVYYRSLQSNLAQARSTSSSL